ncbi:MAG: hypothetical protein KKE73_10930 [Proteobacteria bacterium]|nr:hypothetical protein [Pseudomonadota bacterium]
MSDHVLPGTQSMSSMTLGDLFTRVRSNLNEVSAAFWTNDDLMYWANLGAKDIATQTLCMGTTAEITLVAGQLEYPLSLSLRYAVDVAAIYNSAKGLKKGGPWRVGNTDAEFAGEPVEYYLFDGHIGVYPVPAEGDDSVDKKVKVYLAELPTAMTAVTDLIPLPEIYESSLIEFVTARAKYKDRKYSEGDRHMSLFDAVIQRYRIDFGESEVDD